VDTIILSPQFLSRRVAAGAASPAAPEKPAAPKLIKTDFRKEN